MSHARILITVACVSLAGCFSPDVPDGALLCSIVDGKCPTGFHCAADKACWRDGNEPDLAGSADLSAPGADLKTADGDLPHDLSVDQGLDLAGPDLAQPDLLPGLCVGVTCTALDQCHDVGVCNPSTGVCSNPNKTNGTSCNDSSACTTGDTCQGGTCTGTAVVCTASDQCHDVGTCNPSDGTCSNPAKSNGSTCNDADACTQSDTCQAGACVGASPVTCAASDSCHNAGVCNMMTGVCSNPIKSNGSGCNDGNPCTTGDTCQAGTCTSGAPVTCSPIDQCHVAGVCDSSTGLCSNPNKSNGTACNDGNLCTQSDTCQSGVCTGANPIVCNPLDQCHIAGTCNPASGACSNPNKGDGSSCSDGNACTLSDSCQTGTCVGTNPVVCTPLDQCHVAGTCNPASGACSNPNAGNGSACSDGNACTLSDTCQNGSCSAGTPKTCTALDQCHVAGVCDTVSGNCTNPNKGNGSPCSDGNLCTQTDTCQSGTCTGMNPVVCTASDQCHAIGTCDPTSGLCSNPNATNGTTCNDANVCTVNDVCTNGTCAGGAQPEFVDQSVTTFDDAFSPSTPFWQEFVASTKGTLTKIGIFKNGLSGAQTVTVNVYNGAGLAGTRIYTGSVTLPNVSAEVTVTLPGSGPLLASGGHYYTFQFVDPSNTLQTLCKDGNTYPAGLSGAPNVGGVGVDYFFKTYMLPVCP